MNACTRPNRPRRFAVAQARHAASGQHGVAGVKHHPRVLNRKMNWTDKPHPPAKPATALQRQVSGVQGAAPFLEPVQGHSTNLAARTAANQKSFLPEVPQGTARMGPARAARLQRPAWSPPRPCGAAEGRGRAMPSQEDVGPSKAEQTCGCMHPGAQPRPPGRAAQLRGQWRQRGSLRARRRPRRATASARAARRHRAAGPSRQRALQSPARCARAARRRRAAGRRAAAAGAHAARRGRPPLLRRGAALAATS